MFCLGIMGSPRQGGNTELLLEAFLTGVQGEGGEIAKVSVSELDIAPCLGCRFCEQEGYCRQGGDGMGEVYHLLRRAELVVVATPIFFYGPPAQLKALIDRCQILWARRYIMKLTDPKASFRRGFLLAVGATKGENLFTGTSLTAKYFFDAIGARYEGYLGFRHIEKRGEIAKHPTALDETRKKGKELAGLFSRRRRVLFLCRENAGRSQMAEAFLQYHAGDRFEAESAGDQPAAKINPFVAEVMAQRGIDLAFRRPKGIDQISEGFDLVVQMGCKGSCPVALGKRIEDWGMEDPAGRPLAFVRALRDEIEQRVRGLIDREG